MCASRSCATNSAARPGTQKSTAASLPTRCARSWRGEYDLVTWVPLSRRRLRERGYDQARLLARSTARELGLPLTPTLHKQRNTQPQSGTGDAAKRRANIAGAYRMKQGADVTGKRVLLMDDIVTTGATLSECARVLGKAGAEQVVCATVARSAD